MAFARLVGWTLFDPLTGRMPLSLRVFIAAVLAAVLAPGLSLDAIDPFTVQGMLALALEGVWGAALALCVWLVFATAEAMLAWTGHTATGGLLTLHAEQAAPADAAWRALAGWLRFEAVPELGATALKETMERLAERLKVKTNLRFRLVLEPPGALERYTLKAKRFKDLR